MLTSSRFIIVTITANNEGCKCWRTPISGQEPTCLCESNHRAHSITIMAMTKNDISKQWCAITLRGFTLLIRFSTTKVYVNRAFSMTYFPATLSTPYLFIVVILWSSDFCDAILLLAAFNVYWSTMICNHSQSIYTADPCLENRSSAFAVTHFPVTLSSFYGTLISLFLWRSDFCDACGCL